MRKLVPILMLTILCIFSSNKVYASSLIFSEVSNQTADSIFRSQVETGFNQLKSNQNRIRKDYKSMKSYLIGRDSVISASLDNSNLRISSLEDSLGSLNKYIQKEQIKISQYQTESQKQFKVYAILLAILLLFVFVLLVYSILRNRKYVSTLSMLIDKRETLEAVPNLEMDSFHNKLDELQRKQTDILSEIKTLYMALNDSKDASATNANKVNQIAELLNKISTSISSDSAVSVESESVANFSKPDRIAYDAAVDAWININEHLSTLGGDRKKIPHVYALLAGEAIDESTLRADLFALNEERKEEVSIIISDIRRFMAQHLNAIETWISYEAGTPKTLKDVVRFPLGKAFDQELDEEVTGEFVENGKTVRVVTHLGYLFPGSRNGWYRKKSKILV